MEILLKRYESKNCYLRGHLMIDNDFICDSLEFNSELTLKSGFYDIAIYRQPHTYEKRVYIHYGKNIIISKLVDTNTELVKLVKHRIKNSLIEIGILGISNNLLFFSQVNKLLIEKIEKAQRLGEDILLNICNNISDNFEE